MKADRQKKPSLPPIQRPEKGKSVGFSDGKKPPSSNSQRTGLPSLPAIPRATAEDDEASEAAEDRVSTFKFVYSQAVERAFRRCFCTTDFGPTSAKPAVPSIEIVKLPQLYDDWLTVKGLIAKKQDYIRKLREEKEENQNKHNKYHNGRYKYASRNRVRLNSLNTESRRSSMNSGVGAVSRMTPFNRSLPSLPRTTTNILIYYD